MPSPAPIADTLFRGDCRQILPQLSRASVQLVLTSPPFNVSWNYADGGASDTLSLPEYKALLKDFLTGAARVLRPGGVLAVNLPPTIEQDEYRAWPIAAWFQMQLLSPTVAASRASDLG
jgi:DNA modification methylase